MAIDFSGLLFCQHSYFSLSKYSTCILKSEKTRKERTSKFQFQSTSSTLLYCQAIPLTVSIMYVWQLRCKVPPLGATLTGTVLFLPVSKTGGRGKVTGLKTDAEAGADGEHEGVFRAVGLEDRIGGFEVPRYLGLDVEAEVFCKGKLQGRIRHYGPVERVVLNGLIVDPGPDAAIHFPTGTQPGGEASRLPGDSIRLERDSQIMDTLVLFTKEGNGEYRIVHREFQSGSQSQPGCRKVSDFQTE